MVQLLQGTERQEMRARLYEWLPYKLEILGANGVVLPLLADGIFPSTTFNTIGDLQATFTWDADISSRVTYENGVPVITFDGVDDEADSPDADFWSRGDGSNDSPCTFGAWVSVTDTAGWRTILVKGNLEEWDFRISPLEEVQLVLGDASAAVFAHRVSGGTVPLNIPTFVVATYDGAGGASAADTINLYINGGLSNGTITNHASYVAMENTTGLANLGMRQVTPEQFDGSMCGGPLGPFFTHKELSADEIIRIYQAEAKLLGVFQ